MMLLQRLRPVLAKLRQECGFTHRGEAQMEPFFFCF